ncbi:MAG: peptidylprolyl isomerase, partial [Tepidisphaeraceae bacterium]
MSLVVRSAAVSLSSSRPSVALEALEGRTLFHLAEISQIADFSVLNSSAPTQINLNSHFDNEDFDGTLVRMTSVLGNIDIELFDGLKPQSVSNFLNNYVDTDRYNNSIIHRSDSLDSLTVTPKEILQGGGFSFPGFTSVATGADPTVPNEFTTNGVISNTRGTLAYAKGSDPDSATSQWFLNLADNSAGLDNPANAGGFTVFGQLVNGTLSTADAIAALQTFAFADPFGALPLRDYTTFPSTPTADNVVLISDVSRLPETTYTAISDNAAVTPTVDANGVLSLAYAPGITGTAEITVVATALDGDSEKQTFDVTVNAGSSVPSSFGIALGTGGAKKVKFTDADGTAVEISAKKGAVTVRFSADNFQQSESKGTVTLTGTNIVVDGLVITQSNSTEITVKTKNGDGLVSIGDISADGTVKKISAKGVNLFGDVGIAGDLKDASFNSVGTGTFTAANFGKVKITGAFAANVGGGSIKEFKSGSITSGTWGLTGGASKVRTGVVDSSAGFVAAFNGEVKEFRVDGDADVDLTASRIKKLKIGGRLH